MISTLRVQNLALIDELELELGGGFHVITGETGAGKSILLQAVALLSGARASSEAVRSGAAEARVEAIFESESLVERARTLGIPASGDRELLIARSISREGRSRVFVNGSLSTAAVLAQLMSDVIEVGSQSEHLRLLRPELQTELLDLHGELGPQLAELQALVARWRELGMELEAREKQVAERARREDQLAAELAQIERAAPREGEEEELEQEHRRLAHIEQLGQSSSAALAHIDDEGGAREALAAARASLRSAVAIDPALGEAEAGLERAELELRESALLLERYRASLDADPSALARAESRIGELLRLKARFGPSVPAILAYAAQAREELARIGGGEERTRELREQLEALRAQTVRCAEQLSARRAEAASDLTQAVRRELAALELGKAAFEVQLEPVAARGGSPWSPSVAPSGAERAQFVLAANPGEAPRRLRDAASGGELARLLLALRNALRDGDRGRVLLFDEVDAGVGGSTASRVGERLRRLARDHDVLCITHLPQLAALGRTHYRVHKSVRAGRTATRVERLEGDARVEEIARMLSAGRITEAARAHARELLSL